MPGKVLTGAVAYFGELDISGVGSDYAAAPNLEVAESRTWDSDAVGKEPGLRNDSSALSGVLTFDPIDSSPGLNFFEAQGTKVPFSVFYGGAAPPVGDPVPEGDPVQFGNPLAGTIGAPAVQGDLLEFSLEMNHDGPIIVGKCGTSGLKSAVGNSVGLQLGPVASGQGIYANLHVIEANSGSIDVTIESDDDSGFPSPITRLTFPTFTVTPGASYQFLIPPIGITDDWWRVVWAGVPDHLVAVAMGIT